jgi:hypothetical protein
MTCLLEILKRIEQENPHADIDDGVRDRWILDVIYEVGDDNNDYVLIDNKIFKVEEGETSSIASFEIKDNILNKGKTLYFPNCF